MLTHYTTRHHSKLKKKLTQQKKVYIKIQKVMMYSIPQDGKLAQDKLSQILTVFLYLSFHTRTMET